MARFRFERFVRVFIFLVVAMSSGTFARVASPAGANDGLAHKTLDQTTPRRTMSGFLTATRAGQFEQAAHYLDLRDTPRAEQSIHGPELARELSYVLDRKAQIDLKNLEDDATSKTTPAEVIATTVTLGNEEVSIALVKAQPNAATPAWVLSRSTVALIPALYTEFGPKGWEGYMPEILTRASLLGNAAWQWLGLLALVGISYFVGRFLSYIVVTVWRYFAKRTKTLLDDNLISAVRTPLRILFAIAVFRVAVDSLALTVVLQNVFDHVTFSLLVIGLSLLFLRLLGVIMGWTVSNLPTDTQHEFRRREVRTRFGLLLRIADVVVVILATAAILTQFSFVRTVGLSVLASAGIAGVVVGLAAQKSVSSVIAGIQISLTQPIRIGDVVKVEGQSGVVEEVSLTNVVLRLSDQRRLIVPVSRFLDQPFENWTRRTTELLGIVTLVVDFSTPMDELRVETKRILEQ
ncbi:MAG: mechanosensitive ion channel domain-containing protein, partial [Polyangiaceae bacterium]